ncbi:unnamed protein product [Rotaria socialis]|uniref:Uncharacterized protein n=3 Tax=Rotaria socialis TaxID=392032 RepID=A0A821G021_9BILA|nr:unnamed protein product [Rotaria socialis]CAF4615270.1 unnamed protein product [Rotaria socialis]CAF4655670.1 unnamed protein product [Rotaria socialis]
MTSPSKISIISLSSFDTTSSHKKTQCVSCHNHTENNNNNNNDKSSYNVKQPIKANLFNQTIDQAVEYFEQILKQCTSSSNTTVDQQERINDNKLKVETKKRDCEEFLNLLNTKKNFKLKQRDQKVDCRHWCEEQNQRIAKYNNATDGTNRKDRSKNRNNDGSIFYCRKALLQKSDGITYICIRKRLN